MKEVLITSVEVLKAKEARAGGEHLIDSCAMWQALVPFVTGSFHVAEYDAYNETEHISYSFTPKLPHELYRGQYDVALAKIEEHGPYKFQVEGLE